jgi:hypothetical protein
MEDKYKFFRSVFLYNSFTKGIVVAHTSHIGSGVLSAMSAMVNLEIPWINVMSKMDLVTANPDDESGGARNGLRQRKDIAR